VEVKMDRRKFLIGFWFCVGAVAQTPDALFQAHCAACHNAGNTVGAPLPQTLRQMSWKAIVEALENGKMKGIGDALSSTERELIAKSLGVAESQPASAAGRCAAPPRVVSGRDWNGWADAANTRLQSAEAAGLKRESVARLKLKWAFGFPGVTTAFGTPTKFQGRLLVGDANGVVYSLDAVSGCVDWTFSAVAGVRGAPVVGGGSVYFGDLRGNVYAVRLDSGALVWKTRADDHPLAVITGSVKLDAGRLYVPVSGRDESIAATNPGYECCTFRGSVVAIDTATGRRVWQAYTIAETPKVTGRNAKGAKTWGPSGAVPWSSPTLDLEKRLLYVGTGVNYSQPTTATSDALLAFDLDTGKLRWSRQLTSEDAYNFACSGQDKTNCPRDPFVDVDFGNSGVLRSLGGGRRVLAIADKGGTIYGVDPDREGKLLWKQKVASGGLNGGFMWGGAADEQGVAYFGISDFTAGKPEVGGGLIALQLATGEKLWRTPAPKPACLGQPGCSPAQPAPVTLIPGVALLGSWDGHLRAYDTKTGAILWDFDTAREFSTVNAVSAHGGSINSMAPVVAGGMLYMTSGYSGTVLPGNVLLAFSVDGK
jgi:polyvinyl alcohol dehydrogenase (cytochrome)